MGRVFKRMTVWLAVVGLVFSATAYAGTDFESSERIVARVGDLKVPLRELNMYARNRPDLAVFLSIPGGGRKLAETWAQERLVVLHALKNEGKEPYEAIGKLSQDEITEIYIQTVKKDLPPAQPVTIEDAKEAYEKRPQDYTVPARIYLRQMSVPLTKATQSGTVDELRKDLGQARQELDNGGDFDTVYAKAQKQIPNLAEHDFGFIPLDGSYEGEEAVKNLEQGQTSIYETKDAVMLFYVLEKRPAILEPFDRLQGFIMNDLKKKSEAERWKKYLAPMMNEFQVEILL